MPPSLPNGESKTRPTPWGGGGSISCSPSHLCCSPQTLRAGEPGELQGSTTRIDSLTVSPSPFPAPSVSNVCVSAEDSGNSSEDSEAEEPPNKKLSPWRVRNDPPILPKEDVVKEEAEEVTHNMADVTEGHLTEPSPDASQDTADKFLHQSEEEEEEPGEEPPGEASVSLHHLDKGQAVPAGQEVVPPPSSVGSSPPPPLLEENDRSALSVHRLKARRGGKESPPHISACGITTGFEATASPPHGSVKRAEEALVVLHCLPSQQLPPDTPAADSDTDSAPEEDAPEEGSEDGGSALNLKTPESLQLCPEPPPNKAPPGPAKAVVGTPPKALPSLLLRDSEPRAEEQPKGDEAPRPPEDPQGRASPPGSVVKEPQGADAPGAEPAAAELEPQMGPEALVCYEVDLDDPEDKEKPSPPEHLLLLMEEPAPLPLPILLPQHQVRAFPAAMASCPPPCLKELHPLGKPPEERAAVTEESGASSVQDRGELSLVCGGSHGVTLLTHTWSVQVTRGHLTAAQVQAQRNQNEPRNESARQPRTRTEQVGGAYC